MHFRTAASAAILACAAHASAEPQPYKLAMMPVLGMGLSRRQTNGYQPEQTVCGDGNTCAEACGGGYTECAAVDDSIHCYNPEAKQLCCQDGTGNSCDDGYYCTHDTKQQTWCCPDSMDLVQCAAAYNVEGGLETPVASTSTPIPTTATTVEPTTSAAPTTTSSTTPTSEAVPTTSSVASTTVYQPNTTTVYETTESETSTFTPISSGTTSIWTGSNSTITSAAPTQPSESGAAGTSGAAPVTTSAIPGSGAAATGFSAALLLAAGLIALL